MRTFVQSQPVAAVLGTSGEDVIARFAAAPSSLSLPKLAARMHEVVAAVSAAAKESVESAAEVQPEIEMLRFRVELPTRSPAIGTTSTRALLILFTTATKTAAVADEERRLIALLGESAWEWRLVYLDLPSLGGAEEACDAFESSEQDFGSLPLPQLHIGMRRRGGLRLVAAIGVAGSAAEVAARGRMGALVDAVAARADANDVAVAAVPSPEAAATATAAASATSATSATTDDALSAAEPAPAAPPLTRELTCMLECPAASWAWRLERLAKRGPSGLVPLLLVATSEHQAREASLLPAGRAGAQVTYPSPWLLEGAAPAHGTLAWRRVDECVRGRPETISVGKLELAAMITWQRSPPEAGAEAERALAALPPASNGPAAAPAEARDAATIAAAPAAAAPALHLSLAALGDRNLGEHDLGGRRLLERAPQPPAVLLTGEHEEHEQEAFDDDAVDEPALRSPRELDTISGDHDIRSPRELDTISGDHDLRSPRELDTPRTLQSLDTPRTLNLDDDDDDDGADGATLTLAFVPAADVPPKPPMVGVAVHEHPDVPWLHADYMHADCTWQVSVVVPYGIIGASQILMRVSLGGLQWSITRALADFERLVTMLRAEAADRPLDPSTLQPMRPSPIAVGAPPLPWAGPKSRRKLNSLKAAALAARRSAADVETRALRAALDTWLRQLLRLPGWDGSAAVAWFIGAATALPLLLPPAALKHRSSLPLAHLAQCVQAGDIILFRCHMPHSVAQRAITGAEFDHIAIVTEDGPHARIIEAIADGVRAFDFQSRLMQYCIHFAECASTPWLPPPRFHCALFP